MLKNARSCLLPIFLPDSLFLARPPPVGLARVLYVFLMLNLCRLHVAGVSSRFCGWLFTFSKVSPLLSSLPHLCQGRPWASVVSACVWGARVPQSPAQTHSAAPPAPGAFGDPAPLPAQLPSQPRQGRPGAAGWRQEAAPCLCPRPPPRVIDHFRLLTWGPGPSPLRRAAARGSSAHPGGGRRGRGPRAGAPEAGAGAWPAAGGWAGGRKLPEQISAEVGPAVRQCGTPPPPPASAAPTPHPLFPTPSTPGSASWVETGVWGGKPWREGLRPAPAVPTSVISAAKSG